MKQHTAIDYDADACVVLHRSKIDHDDAEVSLVYHFSAVCRGHAMRDLDRWKVVPRGEIFINPSDPKHVA